MKAGLQLKLGQQLALTPQLQQSLRLLQMSSIELNEEIERLLLENPLLEKIETSNEVSLNQEGIFEENHTENLFEDTGFDTNTASLLPTAEASNDTHHEEAFDATHDATDNELWAWDGHGQTDHDEDDFQPMAANIIDLRTHLISQLAGLNLTKVERILLEMWIDSLDERGFVSCSIEELAELLPEGLDISLEDLAFTKSLLQSLSPTGVGASSIQECLLLQLRQQTQADSQTVELTKKIIENHLDFCADKNYKKLIKLLKCDEESLRLAIELLCKLDPNPTREFGGDAPRYVVPDIVVQKNKGEWCAVLNANALPHVRINEVYAHIIKEQRRQDADDALQYLTNQLQEAKFFLRSIEQRYVTILRVADFIVKHQKNFFSQGDVAMKPMVIRDVAESLGIHESTVSRVTQQKYMQTPHGLFELKYFFSSHVATDVGGAASSTAIKAVLKNLIENESSKKPLSDQKLVELLEEQGFVVARRTVAKYREQLGFAAAHLRKTL